jgi:hypothetical protein
MSGVFATCVAALVFASMWACYKLGFAAGQADIITKFQDYCRRASKNAPDAN